MSENMSEKDINLVREILDKLDFGKTINLTEEEELAILNCLTNDDYIGNGSSRVVYDFFSSYVVKIGMSEGGFNQNQVERRFYNQFGHTDCFAELVAYGKTMNIMEKLEDCDCYDIDECDYLDEEISNLIQNVSELIDYYGGDNGQVGFSTIDMKYKLYDYGYCSFLYRSELVDEVDYWMDTINPLENAKSVLKGYNMVDDYDWEH